MGTTIMLPAITSRLEGYMDLLADRQKLVAANLANLDTPGYRTKDLDFQFEFLSQTPGGTPNVIEPTGLTMKNDGNNVSLDRESRLLAENALRFNVATNLLRNELRTVRKAIDEGKGA